MAVHIFLSSEENYEICVRRGIVGLPEPPDNGAYKDNTFDAMLSRLSMIRENDYILIYIIGKKELRGVWKADGNPFYDETLVWKDRIYPFRCRLKVSEYCFERPLSLNDVNDLRNSNRLWSWSMQRASGTNAMFSISDCEFSIIINEFLKINPFTQNVWRILEPCSYHKDNLIEKVHSDKSKLKYEKILLIDEEYDDNII